MAPRKKPKSNSGQSARFIEAAKAADADQKEFERAFKRIVKPKKQAKRGGNHIARGQS